MGRPRREKAAATEGNTATRLTRRRRQVVALPAGARVSSLAHISEAVGSDKSPQEVLQFILKAARSITRATSASLMLCAPETGILRVMAAEGFKGPVIYRTELKIGQGVTGWVAETGVPLRLGNVSKDARYVRVQRNLRSELAVPLKVRGRVIGVISVDSTRLNHFTAEDEALLVSLAAHSSRVIETTRLLEEARRRAEERSLLLDSSRVLSGTLDFHQVLERLAEMTARFWRAPISAVYLASEDGKQLLLAACHGGTDGFRKLTPLPVAGTLLGRVLHGDTESVTIEDLRAEVRPEAQPVVAAAGLASLMAVPLVSQSRPLGVLCVFSRERKQFGKDAQSLLAGLARSAALAIENAQAHRRTVGLEERLRDAEKSALMVELAAGLAHEIRNPLTSIRILFDSLVQATRGVRPAPDSTAAEDAGMLKRQFDRLEKIVEDYLGHARARAASLQARRLDLNAVVDESLLLLANAADEGTRMVCSLHPGELPARGDPTQLSQAVYNLVLNAVQAVRAAAGGHGRVEVRTGRGAAGGAWLEVADDGPGVASELRGRLFQPFLSTKKQGVGLGLSIVKRIVDAHGGTLEVESPRADLGRGARFRITLPPAT
jgi:signal transduction histidine kinase